MNSEGEKMPPDEPEPRLVDVASILQTNSRPSNQAAEVSPTRMLSIVL